MDNKIYLKDWLEFKPYKKQTKSDFFYLRVCNDVKKVISTNKYALILNMYLGKKEIDLLACFLTSYLEDQISETNIWNSFVKLHKRMYGIPLPFYSMEDYFEEEINGQDVSFLIWYFLNTMQREKFIAPFNDFIQEISGSVMTVFDDAWEYAPENETLQSFYQFDEIEVRFDDVGTLIEKVLFNTYLFYPDTKVRQDAVLSEIIKEYKGNVNAAAYINEQVDDNIHRYHTKLLNLTGKEWATEIFDIQGHNRINLLEMSPKIKGLFLYKGQDDANVFIEHIASEKKFNVSKKTFPMADNIDKVDTIIYSGIVKWKGEWCYTGLFFKMPFDPQVVMDEKNSFESRNEVNFLDHQLPKTEEILNKQLEAFKKYNKGSQIAFLKTEEFEEFHNNFIEYLIDSSDNSKKEKIKAKENLKLNREINGSSIKDLADQSDSILFFYNPKSGGEIALSANSAFPMPSNPYFNEEESEEDVLHLLINEEISKELVMFCLENCQSKLPFFQKEIGKKYLEDIDFLLRFWKGASYHTTPSISFTGAKDVLSK